MRYIVSTLFCMLFLFPYAQISIRVKYLNDDKITFTDVTSTVKVSIATDSKGTDKKELIAIDGFFKLDSLPTDCPYFQLEDQHGEMHVQKICMGLKAQKEWTIYIGSKCLYHYEGYQPAPFLPVFDKIYLSHSFNQEGAKNDDEEWTKRFEAFNVKLDELGLTREFPANYKVYSLDPSRRTEIVNELSKMEDVNLIAPIQAFGKSREWYLQYFSSTIEILFLKDLSDQAIKEMTIELGIKSIEKNKLEFSTWKAYKYGFPYRIELKYEVMMDYSFLKKIQNLLLKNEQVLVVKTSSSVSSFNH